MTKLGKLQTMFQEHEIDALLVTNPFNRRYITNFTGTAGVALITSSEAFFITDFRYTNQAKEQAKDYTIVEHQGPMEEKLSNLIAQLNIKRLGFEETNVTYAQYA